MANQEKDVFSNEHFNEKGLEQAGDAQRELLRESLERNDRTPETSLEAAHVEALKHATSIEKEQRHEDSPQTNPERGRVITKKEKEKSFNATMQEVRTQMSPSSRAFSKIIHQPVVEKTSDFVGNTIARPNAILSGAIVAFIFTTALYLIARFNGYPLSGGETIASFVLGWCVGLIIDYARLLFLGKK